MKTQSSSRRKTARAAARCKRSVRSRTRTRRFGRRTRRQAFCAFRAFAGRQVAPVPNATVLVTHTFTDGTRRFASGVTDESGVLDGIALAGAVRRDRADPDRRDALCAVRHPRQPPGFPHGGLPAGSRFLRGSSRSSRCGSFRTTRAREKGGCFMSLRSTPVIPEYITVHLGLPDEPAENVRVAFPDYIKNVASSEIYPNWPEAAVRANILAQISYALNRVYTEFLPQPGLRLRHHEYDAVRPDVHPRAGHFREHLADRGRHLQRLHREAGQRAAVFSPSTATARPRNAPAFRSGGLSTSPIRA